MDKILYHATETDLWYSTIKREGLKKYDLGENVFNLRPYWNPISNGIWLWTRMTEKLARECYLFQRVKKGVPSFLFLECKVKERWLLSFRLEKKYAPRGIGTVTLYHPLTFNGVKIHDEVFDICLHHIPVSRIRPLFIVEERIVGLEGGECEVILEKGC